MLVPFTDDLLLANATQRTATPHQLPDITTLSLEDLILIFTN